VGGVNGVDGLKVNAVEMDSMGRYDELRLTLCKKECTLLKSGF
jgi:hypothetical protein